MRRLILISAVVLSACAATPVERERAAAVRSETQAALDKELAGLVPGEPTTCLPEPARTQLSSEVYGSTIVYRASRAVKYRSDTDGPCGRGNGNDILVTRTPLSRVCRGDIVQTFDRTSRFPTGSCALGDFVPYRKPS